MVYVVAASHIRTNRPPDSDHSKAAAGSYAGNAAA